MNSGMYHDNFHLKKIKRKLVYIVTTSALIQLSLLSSLFYKEKIN